MKQNNSEESEVRDLQKMQDNKKVNKTIGCLWTFVFGFFALIALAIFAISQGWLGPLPPLSDLQNPINKYASRVYTADGKLMGTWSYARENRLMVTYDSLPDNLIKALVATEDVRFYEHSGIDLRSTGRAIVKRGLMHQKSAGGGSTITQQLAKQLYSEATQDVNKRLMQKPIEWYIAVQLERKYTKEEIITMYFNYFDFLYNAVGIKNASRTYFNKEPIDLNLSECATLVGMCKNPSLYNPVKFPEKCKERRNVVLSQMRKAGYLTDSEMIACQSSPIDVTRFHIVDHKDGIAPYVRELLRRTMMAKRPDKRDYASWQSQKYSDDSLAWETDPLYGWCNKNTKKDGSNYDIYSDGLKVYTTIDSRMQQYAEDAVYEHVAKYLQPKFNSEKKNNRNAPYTNKLSTAQVQKILERNMKQSDRYRTMKAAGYSEDDIIKAFNTKTNMTVFSYDGLKDVTMTPMDSIKYYKFFLRAGFMSMEPKSGKVKAYVGGLNFNYFQYDNVMGGGRRQIGSTMKPLLYALAMENGFTPCDVAPCVARSYNVAGRAWRPRGGATGGMVTLKWGLSRSNNHVSAWLMNQLSSKQLVNLMHLMGINNNAIHPSLALCLGPCDVGVGEMVSAYTSFANGGVRTAPLLVTKIEDADGNVVASFTPRVNVVISANSSYKMIDMMRAVINEGTGRRLRSHYKFTADICGKTGTTNNNSDAWFIGYTPSLVTGVWVGGEERDIHFNSMTYGQGAAASLPVWGIYMQKVYANKELGYSQDEKFVFPEGFEVCINESLEGLSNSESVIYERKRKNAPVEEKEEEATPGEFDEMFQ